MSLVALAAINCLHQMLSEREGAAEEIHANWSSLVKKMGTSDLIERQETLDIEVALLEEVIREVKHAIQMAKD